MDKIRLQTIETLNHLRSALNILFKVNTSRNSEITHLL